jgi:prophage regulatory protein
MPTTSLLRRPSVTERTGKPESSLYRDIELGLFTQQIKIGPKSVAWPASEVDALVAARVAGMSDDQIRALVKRLHAARASFAEAATVEAATVEGGHE